MRRILTLAVFVLCGTAVAVSAQTGNRLPLQFVSNGDTVIGALSGATFSVTVQSGYDPSGWGLDSFALRFSLDATHLAFVGAAKLCPNTTAPLNTSVVGNVLTVSTSSCNAVYYGQPVFQLTFQLAGGAVDGTWLSMVPVVVLDNGGNNRVGDATADVAQVCHASGLWGDLDGDGLVNSRDALITLSAAVGLPSGGFNLGPADVDADGQVTSRDALAMLSNSIGLPTYGFRVGNGIVDRCAAQLILPRPLFFVRGGPNPGLAIRATDSTVTIPGDLVDISESYPWRPRVSPDGSQVLFVCLTGSFYQNICKANADGSGVVNLTNDYVRDASPDWSPDGTQIVFVRNNQIWMMDTSGATPVQAISSPASGVTSVAWQPISGSHHVAYTLNVCCTYSGEVHTTILDTTGSDIPVRQMVCCAVQQPRYVDWNATGDSLIFDVYVDGYLSIAAAPAAAGAGLDVRIAMNGVAEQPAWTDQGILFVTATTASYRLFLQRPDGSLAQVRPDNVDNFLPGMKRQ